MRNIRIVQWYKRYPSAPLEDIAKLFNVDIHYIVNVLWEYHRAKGDTQWKS